MGSTSSATFLRKHRLAGAAISPRGFRRALRGSNQHPNEPSLLYNDPPCIPSSGFSELPSRSLLLCSVISSRGCAPLAVLRIAVIITTRNDCRLSLTTITDPDSMPSLDSAPSITTIRRQISSFLLFTRSARPSHCARSCPLDLSGAFGCFQINSLARKLGLDCGCFTKQTDRRSYPWSWRRWLCLVGSASSTRCSADYWISGQDRKEYRRFRNPRNRNEPVPRGFPLA